MQKGDQRSSCPGHNDWGEQEGAGATRYEPPHSMPLRVREEGGRYGEFAETDESMRGESMALEAQVYVVEFTECSRCAWRVPGQDSETADAVRERDDDDGVGSVQYGLGQVSIEILDAIQG